jgi:uncharacterized cupin superfamily protein
MSDGERSGAAAPLLAAEVPPRNEATLYPAPIAERVRGREKRTLGDRFGLKNFGVNLTRLQPGARSALKHCHSAQDEFVYILAGHPTLILDEREFELEPGMCAGFAAGRGSHCIVNRTEDMASFLEVGDRTPGDDVSYPDDDLRAYTDAEGKRRFVHKDGTPY